MRSKSNLEKYVSYENLANLAENTKVIVNRIDILAKFAKMQTSENVDPKKLRKITDIHKKLLEADKKNKPIPVWGLELTIKEIKEIFSIEDISPTSFRLPDEHRTKDPMELNSGEELYEYLKDKSDEEIEEYFVSRGAVIEDGIMLNNGLATLYRIEKDSVEKQYDNKEVSPFDGEDDGLER